MFLYRSRKRWWRYFLAAQLTCFIQNGQGKSTLVKLIVGELAPTAGSIILHPLIRIGHFSQHSVEDLTAIGNAQPELTALRYFADKLAESNQTVDEMAIRACLGSFGLQGKTASSTPLSLLSGGQKVGQTESGCLLSKLMSVFHSIGPLSIRYGSVSISPSAVRGIMLFSSADVDSDNLTESWMRYRPTSTPLHYKH
jgi:hypothetical protein